MVNKALSLLLFLLSTFTLVAQDVIIRNDGSEELCKVEEVGIDFVKYKMNVGEGPLITLSAKDVLLIEFSNGKRHVFNNRVSSFELGQEYAGGIIVYVDQSGQHGLVAAPHDQNQQKVMWGPDGNTYANSADDGQQNTEDILAFFADKPRKLTMTAAYTCDRLNLNGYSDWYLPAIDELMYMYQIKDKVPGVKLGDYTSSTEMRKADAYSIHFRPHRRAVFYYNKDNRDYFVRCFRRF